MSSCNTQNGSSRNCGNNTKKKARGWKTLSLGRSMIRNTKYSNSTTLWNRAQRPEPYNKQSTKRKNKPNKTESRNCSGNSRKLRDGCDAIKMKQ